MTGPPDLGVNRLRRSWVFYAGAVLAVVSAGLNVWAGLWFCAAVCAVLGMWVAAHPWIRGQWYRIGEDEARFRIVRSLANGPPKIVCPRCGSISYHPDDIEAGYCGACHDWTAPR